MAVAEETMFTGNACHAVLLSCVHCIAIRAAEPMRSPTAPEDHSCKGLERRIPQLGR